MTKSNNKAREQRILDAAAQLFVRYGYDKTPVSDIAHEAGVSQGAIYLHFESKDALFEALLMREMAAFAEDWLDHLDADPKGGTIGGMYKSMLYALNRSPFMSAMFKQDRRVFGNYLRKPGNFFQRSQEGPDRPGRYAFVKLMQEAGAVRRDLDPKIIAHIMNMLAYGLVAMDEIMPQDAIPPIDDLIEGIAYLMDRALTPEGPVDSDIGKAIVHQIAGAARQQFGLTENPEQGEQP